MNIKEVEGITGIQKRNIRFMSRKVLSRQNAIAVERKNFIYR